MTVRDGFEEQWAEELRRRWAMSDRSPSDCYCDAVLSELEAFVVDVPSWETLEVFYR